LNAKPEKTRLLLVEDNPGDARLVEELLRGFSDNLVISLAHTLAESYACLEEESYDAVLLDLNLPDSTGLDTVRALVSISPFTPVIILTGLDNEELGLKAIQAGAQDYIPKSEMSHSMLKRALRYGQHRMALQNNLCRLVEHNLDPTFVMSCDGLLRYKNQAARNLLDQESLEHVAKNFLKELNDGTPSSKEIELKIGESEVCTYVLHASPIDWEDANSVYLVSLHNVTETKRVQVYLEESNKALQTLVSANADTLRLSSKILESMAEGVIVTDSEKYITAVNPAFTRLTGYDFSEVIGNNPEMLQSGLHGQQFYSAMSRQLLEYGHWDGEIWNRHKNGTIYCVQESINAIYLADGTVSHYVSILRDITARVEREKIILDQALHDSLTGLANRVLLKETLQQHILLAARKNYKVGILFIDVDNFKAINDAFGHMLGDWLLCEMAARMRSCARASDLVARLGGDEFVIVLPDVTGVPSVISAADHIMSELRKPYSEQDSCLDVSLSIGISIWPDHGKNTDELLERADFAMYEVKRNGKGDWRMAKCCN
jgi:diguanylate cyclase (GGDEF)-like protein/PAS domain S-box-containing protein